MEDVERMKDVKKEKHMRAVKASALLPEPDPNFKRSHSLLYQIPQLKQYPHADYLVRKRLSNTHKKIKLINIGTDYSAWRLSRPGSNRSRYDALTCRYILYIDTQTECLDELKEMRIVFLIMRRRGQLLFYHPVLFSNP